MDIKLCPFCKVTPEYFDPGWQMERATLMCPECGVFNLVETWNTRPIEDAQSARIAELEAENAMLSANAAMVIDGVMAGTSALVANERHIAHLEAQVAELGAENTEHRETIAALRMAKRENIEYIATLESQLAGLAAGEYYIDGVDGPDGDGNWEPAEYCIVCGKTNGRHTAGCIVGLVESMKTQLAAVDVSGLPLRAVTKSQLAGTVMVQSLMISSFEGEVESLKAQLAAVPKWTRIDNYDNNTWPPDDSTIVEACQWQPNEGNAGKWWVGLEPGVRLIWLSSFNNDLIDAYYWRPFTPPTEADANGN